MSETFSKERKGNVEEVMHRLDHKNKNERKRRTEERKIHIS